MDGPKLGEPRHRILFPYQGHDEHGWSNHELVVNNEKTGWVYSGSERKTEFFYTNANYTVYANDEWTIQCLLFAAWYEANGKEMII